MELFIWAGGRWRRVCTSSGRVEGWRRRARFVCGRRGALRELPSLAALRSIVKGPRLQKQRVKVKSKAPKLSPYKRFAQNAQIQTLTKLKDAWVQTDTGSIQSDASQKHTSPQKHTSQDNKENHGSKTPQKRFRSASTEIIEARPLKQRKIDNNEAKNNNKDLLDSNGKQKKQLKPQNKHTSDSLSSEEQRKDFIVHENVAKTKQKSLQTVEDKKRSDVQKIVNHYTTDSEITSDEGQCKELIINEEDVLLLRHYIETHNTNIDLLKYDEDDNYKTMIFFKINPLVRLERCPRIAKMLKNRDANATVHFARQLGLQTVTESEDSEKIQRKKTKYRYAKAVAMVRSTIDSENDQFKKKSKRTSLSDESDAGDQKDRREDQSKDRSKRNEKRTERKEEKRKKHLSTTESDTFVESDSDVIEARNTRSNKKDSTSDDAFETRKVRKRAAKELSKPQLISDSDDNTDNLNRNQSSNEQRKNNNKRHVNEQSLSSEDEAMKTQNKTNNKKIQPTYGSKDDKSKQNHHSTKDGDTKDKSKDKNNDREIHKPQEKKNSVLLRRIVVPKRSSVPPGREYSMLEDQAIVAWLSASNERERAVNGNRIWMELQDKYTNLTGQKRTWHSLRNRYLRYILPGLPSLALPSSQAQRLRANATLGELKSRKKQRRNSVFNLPVVRSASARNRPRPPSSPQQVDKISGSSSDSQEVSSAKKRLLRSSNTRQSRSPKKNTQRQKSPSKLYRTSPRKSPTKSGGTKSPSLSVRRTRSPRLSPTYSELTRRLLRNRSTPQQSPQQVATHHKRRLFNPQRPASNGSPAN